MDKYTLEMKLANAYAEVGRALRDLGDDKQSARYFRMSQEVDSKAKSDKNKLQNMMDEI